MTPLWAHWREQPDFFEAISEFVSHRIWNVKKDFGKGTALGVFDNGTMVAGVIYHALDRQAGVLEMSSASDSPRWLSRPILLEMFNYPFNEQGCQAVVLRVDPDNKRLKRILTAYGFHYYELPRLRGRNRPERVFILGDDEWKANGFHKEYG